MHPYGVVFGRKGKSCMKKILLTAAYEYREGERLGNRVLLQVKKR